MSTVPKGRADRLAFYQARMATWTEQAEALNLPAGQVEGVREAVLEAKAAKEAQRKAQLAAQSATMRYNAAIDRLGQCGASVMKQIQASAGFLGSEVYTKALVSPPAERSPIGPPGMPHSLTTQICPTGALHLAWKCKNPRDAEGTIYYVSRQLGPNAPWQYLGHAGKRRFVDRTLPPGSALIHYRIQAARSTGTGPVAIFTVRFGGAATLPHFQAA